MEQTVSPAQTIEGIVTLPGDKSISHRYAMLAAIASGESKIANYSTGADCQSTLRCMQALGAKIWRDEEGVLRIEGRGLDGLTRPAGPPAGELDAGNSGSTIRMLSGILAAQPFETKIGGDESLSRRPMKRIIDPLTQMGARISGSGPDGNLPPLTIHGGPLHGIDYTPPVASAQVKSCVLLAGLFASGDTTVREPIRSRDHTELALAEFGADIEIHGRDIFLKEGGARQLKGQQLVVPGDLSSACFFLVAALMAPKADLVLHGVGMNPSRAALLDFLVGIGGKVRVVNIQRSGGELIGDMRIKTSQVTGGVIEGAMTAALIDEIPALAVLGAVTENGLTVRDAAELRVKETDRIATVEAGLKAMGIEIETTQDGFHVPGKQRFRAGVVDSAGDHRIAMAFAVAGLAADGPTRIVNADAASVSYPEFFDTLGQIAK